jgi:diguanylate cyclase (GGDEF)-like protein
VGLRREPGSLRVVPGPGQNAWLLKNSLNAERRAAEFTSVTQERGEPAAESARLAAWFTLACRGLLRGRVGGSVPTVQPEPEADPASVLFIDLDDFKKVNDGFGHDAGDRLLVEVSQRLLRCAGPSDLVARLGGDEFAVLVAASPDGPAAGSSVAQRIINAMQDPFHVGGHQIHISTSIGIATCAPGFADADSVLMQANTALNHAKTNGKNQFVYFTDEMHQGLLHRLAVASWLRDALARNQSRQSA